MELVFGKISSQSSNRLIQWLSFQGFSVITAVINRKFLPESLYLVREVTPGYDTQSTGYVFVSENLSYYVLSDTVYVVSRDKDYDFSDIIENILKHISYNFEFYRPEIKHKYKPLKFQDIEYQECNLIVKNNKLYLGYLDDSFYFVSKIECEDITIWGFLYESIFYHFFPIPSRIPFPMIKCDSFDIYYSDGQKIYHTTPYFSYFKVKSYNCCEYKRIAVFANNQHSRSIVLPDIPFQKNEIYKYPSFQKCENSPSCRNVVEIF